MPTADEKNLFSSKARGIFRKGLIFSPIKSIIEEKIYAGCGIDDMAQKNKKTEEFISLTAEALKVVSYADYFTQTPLFTSLLIKNAGSDAVTDLTLAVSNENGLLTACVKPIAEVPFESSVEVDVGNILSPLYFVGLEEVRDERIYIELKKDKQTIASETLTVTALPFDYWQGASGNAELLASFVRPKLADCARLQTEIGAQLKKWGVTGEWRGVGHCILGYPDGPLPEAAPRKSDYVVRV